jgi:hypothetical protein
MLDSPTEGIGFTRDLSIQKISHCHSVKKMHKKSLFNQEDFVKKGQHLSQFFFILYTYPYTYRMPCMPCRLKKYF